jgi:hypothetical protein
VPVDWKKIRTMPGSYHVIIRDNYHYQDDDETYVISGFASEAEALAKCKEIVEKGLEANAETGRSAEDIFGYYKMFGEEPSIVSPKGKPSVTFSGWDYAKEQVHRFVR